jgi:hypothetical protein
MNYRGFFGTFLIIHRVFLKLRSVEGGVWCLTEVFYIRLFVDTIFTFYSVLILLLFLLLYYC